MHILTARPFRDGVGPVHYSAASDQAFNTDATRMGN